MNNNLIKDITIIILTLNEEIHIERCINSVKAFAKRIVIVDSGSTDNTKLIVNKLGAEIYTNKFKNNAQQLNWAINNTNINTTWVMKLDADEYLSEHGKRKLISSIDNILDNVNGIRLNLRRIFFNKILKHGGLDKKKILRIWRNNYAICESTWMDEHIIIVGNYIDLDIDFFDHNLKSFTFWINKHNNYSSREVIKILDIRDYFFSGEKSNISKIYSRTHISDIVAKKDLYNKIPKLLRALLFFIYRYFFLMGFLDGYAGFIYHVMQAFWYRYIVDLKYIELQNYRGNKSIDLISASVEVLGIKPIEDNYYLKPDYILNCSYNNCYSYENKNLPKVAKNIKIVAIILTFNEEIHIARCIESISNFVDEIFVVDSYSTDSTVEIAKSYGVTLLQRKWENHYSQFNWALSQLDPTENLWVLRIDADEILTSNLGEEIKAKLPLLKSNIVGINIKRNIYFLESMIKWGGVGNLNILRIFRYGRGICEKRLMDEHLIVDGDTINFSGAIVDRNLKHLDAWVAKHNKYSLLEAFEIFNQKNLLFLTNPLLINKLLLYMIF